MDEIKHARDLVPPKTLNKQRKSLEKIVVKIPKTFNPRKAIFGDKKKHTQKLSF